MLQENSNKTSIDEALVEAMENMGFSLYTNNRRLAAMFDVPVSSPEDIEDAEYWAEEVSGNVVLWVIQTREAVLISKEPSELRDEGQDIGMLVFSRDAWSKAFPNTPYVNSVVQAIAQYFLEYRLWLPFCVQQR